MRSDITKEDNQLKGIFTISLDFELHWGGFEKWDLGTRAQYFLNTRLAIPQMLRMFSEYQVHVTWATVGMLLHPDRLSLSNFAPQLKPSYTNLQLSAYRFLDGDGVGENELVDPFHYAAKLVTAILNEPHQELGSHTFAHYYCNEHGQTIDQFRADLRSAQNSAQQLYGKTLRSLVFPRNQFNDQYLKVCYEEGIRIVRDNPRDWFWKIGSTQNESLWKRVNRGADAYWPIGNKNTYRITDLKTTSGLPICLPASRLLRPYRASEFFLNGLKLRRIKNEMERAAKNGEVYHLWWHPHNFGYFTETNLQDLDDILKFYAYCKERWEMSSLNMGEIALLLE
jgi:peptidoglycan/xylan/chitin deacetylase (PgdA/CDA1 family)